MSDNGRREAMAVMAVASLLSAGMLAKAGSGMHPYAYYGWLRLVVGASGMLVAYTLVRHAPRFAAGGFLALAYGALIAFGRMSRHDWIPFDQAGAVAFALCAAGGLRAALAPAAERG